MADSEVVLDMDSAAAFLCSICQDHYSLVDMRSLPCGHTHCVDCLKKYINSTNAVRGQYPCPHCRQMFTKTQHHPIFLEYADPAWRSSDRCIRHSNPFHRQVASTLKEVSRLEEDQRFQTLQRAVMEIENVSKLMDKRDCLLSLLTAVAARWRGMLTVFGSISKRDIELISLKSKLNLLEKEKAAIEDTADQAIKASEAMIPTLRKTQSDLGDANAELASLKEQIQHQKTQHGAELQEKMKEVRGLHDILQALKTQERKQKQEIKKLREKVKEQDCVLQTSASQSVVHASNDWDPQGDIDVLASQASSSQAPIHGPQQVSYVTKNNALSSARKRKRSESPSGENSAIDEDIIMHDLRPFPLSPPRRSVIHFGPRTAKPPVFSSDWNLSQKQPTTTLQQASGSKPSSSAASTALFPLKLDNKGRPLATVQNGSRQRAKF